MWGLEIAESSGKHTTCNRKHLGGNDRSYHELEVLTRVLEDAACHDQLNLGGNFFVEAVTRCISTITEALHRGPTQANWSQARRIMERSRADALFCRAEICRPTKDRLQMDSSRTRSASHLRRVDVSTEDVPDAVAAGGLPGSTEYSPAGKGKDKRVTARMKPTAAVGFGPAEDDGGVAWRTALPKSTDMGGPFFSGQSGLFPCVDAESPDRGGRANELRGSQALGHFVSRATWALNWMHGEFSRTPAYLSSRVAEASGAATLFYGSEIIEEKHTLLCKTSSIFASHVTSSNLADMQHRLKVFSL